MIFIFCQFVKVVEHIDQQVFSRNLTRFGEAMLQPEIIITMIQLEYTMALVVINDGFVIKLCGAQA